MSAHLLLFKHYSYISSAYCARLFTWPSTSNTDTQAARDKHNCWACGNLVCNPGSKKRVPIPEIGISAPVQVCDHAHYYNGWGTLYGDLDDFDNNDEAKREGSGVSTGTHRSKRDVGKKSSVNSRRSVVVDELASRIPSITS